MAGLDDAWHKLFERHSLAARLSSEGLAYLTADEIRWAGEEPRLMTKFDFPEARPTPLQRAGATILAVENGRYAIVRGNGYGDLRRDGVPSEHIDARALDRLLTLEFPITSESQAIDVAWACGALEHFLGERVRQTIRGRRRSPPFAFQFDGDAGQLRLDVDGVQIEVDGGFEGERAVYLLEAKMGASASFMLRQLYYPYRAWGVRLGGRKPVVPIFMDISNGEFLFVEYAFDPPERYHGARPVRAARYSFAPKAPPPTLSRILADTRPLNGPSHAVFPQADALERVADVVDAVAGGTSTRSELADRWGFAERQGDYYANAAAYIGLLVREGRGWALSADGARLAAMRITADRRELMVHCILTQPPLRQAVEVWIRDDGRTTSRALADIVDAHTDLSGQTVTRRATTLAVWLRTLTEWFPLR